MGAFSAHSRAPAGWGLGLGLLVLLCSCCQQASAQNYTALREGVWLPPLSSIDNVTEAKEYDGLAEKLPQIKGTRAEQQLQLLSASSRSKLNNLTGSAAEWLKNRTDSELEELFENVRAENFRRIMAIASIGTQLRKAFTSSNVLRSLELLQTEDLERVASLPLFEERYQRLTNVTFLELMKKLYDFGLTQVPQRTCIVTAANTSAISRLPNADPATADTSTTSFAAIKPEPATVMQYSILPVRRRSSRRSSSRRRNLLEVVADSASSWLHLDHDEASSAVVRAVTVGPGSGTQARKMLYLPQLMEGNTAVSSDKTVAPIVRNFVEGLTQTTDPDGTQTYQNPNTDPNQDSLLGSAGGIPGLSTQPGFLDSRVIGRGCTENLGAYRFQSGSSGGVGAASIRRTGSSGGSGSGATALKVGTATTPLNILKPVSNCTDGLIFNGTACVPCPAGAVLENSICVCGNGTTWSAATSTCVPVTMADALSLCGNSTAGNGTACSGVAPLTPAATNATSPVARNTTLVETPSVMNATAGTPVGGLGNATLIDPAVVLNNSVVTPEAVMPAIVNASSLPAISLPATNSSDGIVAPPQALAPPAQGDGNTTAPVAPAPAPGPTPDANATAPLAPPVLTPEVLPPAAAAPPASGVSNSSDILPGTGAIIPPQDPAAAASPAPVPEVSPVPAASPVLIAPNAVVPGAALTEPTTPTVPSPSPSPTAPIVPTGPEVPSPSPSPADVISQPEVLTPGVVVPTDLPSPSPAPVAGAALVAPAVEVAPPVPATPPVDGTPPGGLVQPVVEQPTIVPQPPVVAPLVPVQPPVLVQPPVTQVEVPPVVAPATILPPIACVGRWLETGVCNAACEAIGTITSVYEIITQAESGGAPCEAAAGAIKEVPCSNPTLCPKAAPISCVGSWAEVGECKAACESAGTKTSVFTVVIPAANGGAPCEAASGATKEVPCTNPTACPKPPVNCVGSWAEVGVCNAACESTGAKTSLFTVFTPALNGGAECEAASGTTKEVPCSNPTPCPKPPVNCVGSWAETGVCDAKCESTGSKTSVFTVSTPAANGGAACEAASGATRQVPCSNPEPCPKPQVAAPQPVVVAPVVPAPVTPAPTVDPVVAAGVVP